MGKREKLDKLYSEYMKEFTGKEIVLGEGDADAGLLLVGEAPGKDEVRLHRPFVGTAGRNLDEFISLLGIKRESLFITNAIKFRLAKVNPETGGISNRPASREEIIENRKYLIDEIIIIKPKYIVTLGNVPLKSVTSDFSMNIGTVHGTLKKIEVADMKAGLFPLYHPASIIYNRSLKEVYEADILKLKEMMTQSSLMEF